MSNQPAFSPDPESVERAGDIIFALNTAGTTEERETIWQEFEEELAAGTIKMPMVAAA